ncbi:MAG: hypothetical protein GX442_12700 [Candidatus Riflebacteria bacterium]|nr:hypothetical protein [Candidatus Riflebacteria bacterium]
MKNPMRLALIVLLALLVMVAPSGLRAEDDIIPSDQEEISESSGSDDGAADEADSGSASVAEDDDDDSGQVGDEGADDGGSAGSGATTSSSSGETSGIGNVNWADLVSSIFKSFSDFFTQLLKLFGIDVGGTGTTGTNNTGTANTGTTNTGTTGTNDGTVEPDPGGTQVTAGVAAEIRSTYGIDPQNGNAGSFSDGMSMTAGTWSDKDLNDMKACLAKLPACFRDTFKGPLIKNGKITSSDSEGEIYGFYDYENKTLHVSQFCNTDEGSIVPTLVHELTHAFQDKNPGVEKEWTTQFWNGNSPKTSSVSDYGNTNAAEDMAESVREYYQNGASLKASDPTRYEFVKTKIMGGKEF